jgi:hypothetical protein
VNAEKSPNGRAGSSFTAFAIVIVAPSGASQRRLIVLASSSKAIAAAISVKFPR